MANSMPLTDVVLRSLKPADKVQKIADGGGLFMQVERTGSRLWRLSYRFGGKQKTISLGAYPGVPLSDARKGRDAAKALLRQGLDPSQQRKLDRLAASVAAATTFAAVADEYVGKLKAEGRAEATLTKTTWLLDFAKAEFGKRPIAEVKPQEVLAALRKIEARGRLETARRARSTIGAVFRYGISTARAENDPTAPLIGALTTPTVKPRAAVTERKAFGSLLAAVDDYDGAPEVKFCMQLLPLVACRPGELRLARWAEIDLEAALWVIPKERSKMRREHRVPLAPQVVALLRELAKITRTGPASYLFPSIRSRQRPISENSVNAGLRRLGYTKHQATGHGFRASFSTLANEAGHRPDLIEAALGHLVADPIRAAYLRADFLDERRALMVWWADQCDTLKGAASKKPEQS